MQPGALVKWSFSFSFMVVLYKFLGFPTCKDSMEELNYSTSFRHFLWTTDCVWALPQSHLHSVIKQDMQVSHCSVCPQVSYRTQAHSVSKFYFWDACKWNWGAFLACTGPSPILSGPKTVQILLVSKTPWAKMLLYEGKYHVVIVFALWNLEGFGLHLPHVRHIQYHVLWSASKSQSHSKFQHTD